MLCGAWDSKGITGSVVLQSLISESVVGVPGSLWSNDSAEMLLSLLPFPLAPFPAPFLSPMLPPGPCSGLGVWLPLFGSQGDACDWLVELACFPWLENFASSWGLPDGDITVGGWTITSGLDFGLLCVFPVFPDGEFRTLGLLECIDRDPEFTVTEAVGLARFLGGLGVFRWLCRFFCEVLLSVLSFCSSFSFLFLSLLLKWALPSCSSSILRTCGTRCRGNAVHRQGTQ